MIPGIVAGRPVPGSTTLWTPANLAVAPLIWLDWDSSITDVSGYASALGNQGSVGGSFTQSTAGMRPEILASEVGGKRALRFDGSNDYMLSNSAGMSAIANNVSAAWLFAVYKKRGSGTGNNSIFATATGSGGGRFNSTAGDASTARPTMNIRRLDADSSAQLNSSIGGTAAWLIRFDRMDYSTGAAEIFVDGTSGGSNPSLTTSGSTTSSNANPAAPTIGAFANSPGTNPADIDLVVMIFGASSLPSTNERQRLEGWAAWQLGLEGSLPGGHPYKSAPPYV